MDFEQLKQSWNELDQKVDKLTQSSRQMRQDFAFTKATDTQSKLARNYMRVAVIGWCLPFLAYTLKLIGMPMWTVISYGVLGLLLGCANFAMRQFILRCNFGRMDVVGAMRHTVAVIRHMKQLMIAGYVVAVLFLVPFFIELWNLPDRAAFYGAVVGGVVGLIIGIRKECINFRLSREIEQTFRRELAQDDAL